MVSYCSTNTDAEMAVKQGRVHLLVPYLG